MLSAAVVDYNSLPHYSFNIVMINHAFYGLHRIHNLGLTAKETLKELKHWLECSKVPQVPFFSESETRSSRSLWVIKCLLSKGQNCQKAGQLKTPSLFVQTDWNISLKLHGQRINVLFVKGAAAYCHRFLDCSIVEKKLLTFVAEVDLYQACSSSLEVSAKLDNRTVFQDYCKMTGSTFHLNDLWNEVVIRMGELYSVKKW